MTTIPLPTTPVPPANVELGDPPSFDAETWAPLPWEARVNATLLPTDLSSRDKKPSFDPPLRLIAGAGAVLLVVAVSAFAFTRSGSAGNRTPQSQTATKDLSATKAELGLEQRRNVAAMATLGRVNDQLKFALGSAAGCAAAANEGNTLLALMGRFVGLESDLSQATINNDVATKESDVRQITSMAPQVKAGQAHFQAALKACNDPAAPR